MSWFLCWVLTGVICIKYSDEERSREGASKIIGLVLDICQPFLIMNMRNEGGPQGEKR